MALNPLDKQQLKMAVKARKKEVKLSVGLFTIEYTESFAWWEPAKKKQKVPCGSIRL